MDTQLLHSIHDTTLLLGVGRSTLYRLIDEGKICRVKIGRRTLISHEEIRRYINELSGAPHGPEAVEVKR